MSSEKSITFDDSGYDHVYSLLEEIFESCITEADSSELICNLSALYDSFTGQGFENNFDNILLYILSESKRSSEVTKILRFISESVVSLDNKYKTAATKTGTTENIDNIVHPLLKRLFKTLRRWSQASSYVVRSRTCQLLFMILTYIQDHGMGEIDMDTFESIVTLIESRRLDVSSIVRTHAVLLAKFFQDPTLVNDPVIAGLCWQMQYDPNSRVRQNIVSIIAACEETIMPIAKLFLYDKNASVRNAALLHICKRVGPRSFTPSQRVLILQKCFTDSSDVIRRNAEQKLIPVWFQACGDKLCPFFKLVRIGNESLDDLPFMKELTKILSRFVKVSQILEEIELDTDTFLPRLPLSGEKVFLWRQFFLYSTDEERLSKFFPPLDSLIPFILKCFDDSSSEEVEISVFIELILFLMDLMGAKGILKCEDVFPMALNLMRHPFVPHDIMPYLVALYLTYSPKEKENVHNDVLEVIEDLQKLMLLTQGHEINILLKCFVIASQILMDESSLTSSIKNIKDNLIINHLSSEEPKVKIQAISTLALYCLLDIKEAKLSWPLFENALHIDSGPLRCKLLEGAFDILKYYGINIFADLENDGQEKFNETLQSFLTCLEDGEIEQEIILKGILKLYMERHTSSSTLLANLLTLYFLPTAYISTRYDIQQFIFMFGKTKDGYDCIVGTFLELIDLLFDVNKNSPLYKISIKTITLQLLEFTKALESKNKYSGEKFQGLVILKLTKRFLKKPWRLTASELYSLCSPIIPATFDTLLTLKEHVVQILESLQSSIFQQKNPFAKKIIKSFYAYQKKIQVALNTTPLEQPSNEVRASSLSKRLEFDSSSSSLPGESSFVKGIDIQVDSSPTRGRLSSVEDDSHSASDVELENSCNTHASSKIKGLSATPAITPLRTEAVTKSRSPHKISSPEVCVTPEVTTRKIAVASRTRSRRKNPVLTVTEPENSPTFKTPGPRKTPRKRNLNITVTKT